MTKRKAKENTDSRDLLWGYVSKGLRAVDKFIEETSVDDLQRLAWTLRDTIERIRFMVIMPEQFLIYEQFRIKQAIMQFFTALKTGTVKDPKTVTPEEQQAYETALKETCEKYPAYSIEHFDEYLSNAIERKSGLIALLFMEKPYQSLLYSGIMWAWICFEVLSKDLWETVVNLASGKVRSRILNSFNTRPSVTVDHLAKYDYDVKGHLGTIIQENFTFTSLAGIQKAYQTIFPTSQGVSEAFHRPDLIQLEASRHLVVHTSGLVDNEYIRKTKSNLKEGEELPITDRQVLDFCNTTLEICLVLLSASESLIGRNIQE